MSICEFFCCCCGSKEKGNTVREETTGGFNLSCTLCEAGIRFYIPRKPSKTVDEAIAMFESTELTDSQAGKHKRRKRKQ